MAFVVVGWSREPYNGHSQVNVVASATARVLRAGPRPICDPRLRFGGPAPKAVVRVTLTLFSGRLVVAEGRQHGRHEFA
jgi:hypothetical protein